MSVDEVVKKFTSKEQVQDWLKTIYSNAEGDDRSKWEEAKKIVPNVLFERIDQDDGFGDCERAFTATFQTPAEQDKLYKLLAGVVAYAVDTPDNYALLRDVRIMEDGVTITMSPHAMGRLQSVVGEPLNITDFSAESLERGFNPKSR